MLLPMDPTRVKPGTRSAPCSDLSSHRGSLQVPRAHEATGTLSAMTSLQRLGSIMVVHRQPDDTALEALYIPDLWMELEEHVPSRSVWPFAQGASAYHCLRNR